MACKILVSNVSHAPQGEIVDLTDGDHTFTKNESMQSFLNAGGLFDDWPNSFVIFIVEDKEKEEIEFLFDSKDSGERKWRFTLPEPGTPEHLELTNNGEITLAWSVVMTFIGVNNATD